MWVFSTLPFGAAGVGADGGGVPFQLKLTVIGSHTRQIKTRREFHYSGGMQDKYDTQIKTRAGPLYHMGVLWLRDLEQPALP